jgi:hypothetical protein
MAGRTKPKTRRRWIDRHAHSLQARARTMAVAQLETRAEQEFQSQITTARIKLYQAEDGEDATDLLSLLAVVIGTPCDYGALVHGRTDWVRQLHGALRTIQALCLEGYRWRSAYAPAMDRALELAATQDLGEITPDLRKHWEQAWLDACHLSNLIDQHAVTADTVAGAFEK